MSEEKRYKCGDVREDGLMFWAYRPERKNKEYWVTPARFNSLRNNANKNWNLRSRTNEGKRREFDKQVLSRYGITLPQYMTILVRQDCVCAICGKPERSKLNGKTKRLSVDHCHKTGKVRGLLCTRCNTAIGLLDDDPQRVKAVIDYLQASPAGLG